jgi:TonB family protein
MPGAPVEKSRLLDSPVGKLPSVFFTGQKGMATYLVMHVEYPIVFDTPSAVKNAMESGRDMMISGRNAKLAGEKEIAYGKYSGREWKMAGEGFIAYARAYLVNQRLYMLIVTMPEDEDKRLSETQSNEVVKFFDSFKLLKEPDPPPASAGSVARIEAEVDKIELPDDFASRPVSWREFSAKEHGFNIQFPSEPVQQTLPVVPDDRRLDIRMWMAKGNDIICQALAQPFLNIPQDENHKNSLYKGLVAGIVESGELKLLSEMPITFRGHSGREYKFLMDSNKATGKAYIIGSTIYFLLALSIGTGDGEEESARFFDSFTPLDAPVSSGKSETPVGTVTVSGGPILDKATKKVDPDYPPIARAARAEGKVMVQITTSPEGKVIQAEVVEGHPLLRDAALQAARQWEFNPTELSGVPAKVSGVLTFNFTLK